MGKRTKKKPTKRIDILSIIISALVDLVVSLVLLLLGRFLDN